MVFWSKAYVSKTIGTIYAWLTEGLLSEYY